MTYQQALKALKKTGASRATGKPLLAMTCRTLAQVHAINPELVYAGAVKRGIDSRSLMKLAHESPASMADLMFT